LKKHERKMVLLSILIPTLDSRREMFARIYGKLKSQIQQDGLTGEVESLYLRDDGSEPIGVKRNRLMDQAQGQFIVFVDDDDDVHDRYVNLIVSELKEHPEVDSLGIWGEITFRGRNPRPFLMSSRFKDYKTRKGVKFIDGIEDPTSDPVAA
jgi:glycosyltransferase involved in cell wall biosynthesis